MTDQKDENSLSAQPDDLDQSSAAQKSNEPARRRFLKGAAASAPVILTLTARPAWAVNCTLSGQLSGNLSNPLDQCGGEGCSPGYWKTHMERWHPEYQPPLLFKDVFGVDAFPGATLGDVISHSDEPPGGYSLTVNPGWSVPKAKYSNYCNLLTVCGFHSVAALQNSATSVSFDLEVWEVINKFKTAYLSYNSRTIETLKSYLDRLNNQGCPF